LIWISGSSSSTIIHCLSLDNNLVETVSLENITDISASSWNDELFIVTQKTLLSHKLKSQSTPQSITNFNKRVIALDVFEVYSYVLFEDGSIFRVNNLRPMEGN